LSNTYKVIIVDNDQDQLNWLKYSVLISNKLSQVETYSSATKFRSGNIDLSNDVLIVTQALFKTVLKSLSQKFTVHSVPVPFPILLLTEDFENINSIQIFDRTIDAFPIHTLTPKVLDYLLSSLIKDFEKENKLKRLAHIDGLTNATNRQLFNDRLKQALMRAKRAKEPISLMYIDLDKFKGINDQYGHAMGDRYLKTFVSVVKAQIRDADTIGRLGGDEFSVLLPKTDYVEAKQIAKRILEQLNTPKKLLDQNLGIRASIGVTNYSGNEDTSEFIGKLITEKADKAVYEAKKRGRNQYVFYNDIIAH
jgi:diguanylate cyclase (GGDEF)-like protein